MRRRSVHAGGARSATGEGEGRLRAAGRIRFTGRGKPVLRNIRGFGARADSGGPSRTKVLTVIGHR
ncbi:hypothetical protein ADL25_25900 [Streptomyces sp. NRRL F-5122]|nr:hypothetical protein ADL25_25900 [Streptomyces sp. NRRL F-5122]